jgi:hypothetical protein
MCDFADFTFYETINLAEQECSAGTPWDALVHIGTHWDTMGHFWDASGKGVVT